MEELNSKSREKGFSDYKDERHFMCIHLSQWYIDNPGRSCFESEFINEYVKDRSEYEKKPNINKSCVFYMNIIYNKD